MKNATAIAASAGLVLAVAGVSGAMYVSAAQDPASGEVPPATEVIVEYIDEQGNVVPIETTVAESDTTPNSTTESSVKRAYRMEVPSSYVQQARGAMISVVYQPYKLGSGGGSVGLFAMLGSGKTEAQAAAGNSRASWILWLSDAPFAGHDRNWTVPASAGGGE